MATVVNGEISKSPIPSSRASYPMYRRKLFTRLSGPHESGQGDSNFTDTSSPANVSSNRKRSRTNGCSRFEDSLYGNVNDENVDECDHNKIRHVDINKSDNFNDNTDINNMAKQNNEAILSMHLNDDIESTSAFSPPCLSLTPPDLNTQLLSFQNVFTSKPSNNQIHQFKRIDLILSSNR
ncbi:unnamed protein product [Anisakis simplex]|uniref:Uncharacterized protein n=1 Tax=Anisakis simplex TaxID=6269 RepID=A0A0M3JZF4_ANISI|nr:unnamed protein product [Anisakis simplex]